MKFSIITPNFNGDKFLEETLLSVIRQKTAGVNLEYIVVDGQSTDSSLEIIERYIEDIDTLIVEKDTGPANAINKGFQRATGEIVAWLNADDLYLAGSLARVESVFTKSLEISFVFGKCQIIDERGKEIRSLITKFKELFFPVASRFASQSINYISQPAMFFRREALNQAGPLREDLVAAWDYEFQLRLWKTGQGIPTLGTSLSAFRWHNSSISGQNFNIQFKEELGAAAEDAGRFSPQVLIHHLVRIGIVSVYSGMSLLNRGKS